jgi:hypothetical protein
MLDALATCSLFFDGCMFLYHRLAALLIQRHGYPTHLNSFMMRRFIEQSGCEKQTAVVDELAGDAPLNPGLQMKVSDRMLWQKAFLETIMQLNWRFTERSPHLSAIFLLQG